MDENPITHPGVPEDVYHTMGKKTFWIFFLERVHAAFVLLLLTIVLFALGGQSFLVTTPIGDLTRIHDARRMARTRAFYRRHSSSHSSSRGSSTRITNTASEMIH